MAVQMVMRERDLMQLEELLSYDNQINEPLDDGHDTGDTYFHYLALIGDKNDKTMIDLLIRYGADPTIVNNAGDRPVDVALRRSQFELARLIFEKEVEFYKEEDDRVLIRKIMDRQKGELLYFLYDMQPSDKKQFWRQTLKEVWHEITTETSLNSLLISHEVERAVQRILATNHVRSKTHCSLS
jgi:hypothetical protein